jgi:hypothetical protein
MTSIQIWNLEMKITLVQLVDLAQQVETEDPIDWADLSIDENTAYHLIAAGMLEHFNSISSIDQKILMLLATAVKLSVENFVLNTKLLQK